MMNSTLPWEASRAALDLLKYRDEQGLGRPTNREARFFWHIRQASPAIEDSRASTLAALLAVTEFFMELNERWVMRLDWLKWTPAYQPWLSPEAATTYEQATRRERDPIPANPIPDNAPPLTFETFAKNFINVGIDTSAPGDEEQGNGQAR